MANTPESKAIDWTEFLASAPPDSTAAINNLGESSGGTWRTQTPDVLLYCDSEECQGSRFFHSGDKQFWLDLRRRLADPDVRGADLLGLWRKARRSGFP